MVLRDIASKGVVSVPAQRSPYYGQITLSARCLPALFGAAFQNLTLGSMPRAAPSALSYRDLQRLAKRQYAGP